MNASNFKIPLRATMAAVAVSFSMVCAFAQDLKVDPLKKLMDGNRRFVTNTALHPDQSAKRRAETSGGQHPVAAILGCSDSRVPPEIIFDQGLGDLFVVRVAGNVIDDIALGSLEYAVEHLEVPLVMVLGHEKCGAVTAAVKGGEAPGHIGALVKALDPVLPECRAKAGDQVENCMIENAEHAAGEIRGAVPILKEHVEKGKLKVVAARYDMDTGEVTLLP